MSHNNTFATCCLGLPEEWCFGGFTKNVDDDGLSVSWFIGGVWVWLFLFVSFVA